MPVLVHKRGQRLAAAWFIAASLLTATPPASAEDRPSKANADGQDPFYCAERRLGYWFYCTRPKPPERQEPAPAEPASAASRLEAITDELRELKAKAILEPTPGNVTAYIRF